MLPNVLISFLTAIGASAWIYAKLFRSTGNNNKSALTAAGIAFTLLFIFMMLLTTTLFKK